MFNKQQEYFYYVAASIVLCEQIMVVDRQLVPSAVLINVGLLYCVAELLGATE